VRLYKSQTHARTANDHDRQRSREFRYLAVCCIRLQPGSTSTDHRGSRKFARKFPLARNFPDAGGGGGGGGKFGGEQEQTRESGVTQTPRRRVSRVECRSRTMRRQHSHISAHRRGDDERRHVTRANIQRPTSPRSPNCSVLFLSRPRPEGWPHHGRTFSIYPCPLSF